jgi:membrane associated rhomboid family serine protease
MNRYRSNQIQLSFPPFTPAVKWLLGINIGIYLLTLFLGVASAAAVQWMVEALGLVPIAVVHGAVWQLITYAFLHVTVMHVLWNMIGLWMFGGTLEQDWGTKHFLEFYFLCAMAAALVTVAVSFAGTRFASPTTLTYGASGAVYGILMAYGVLYGDQEIYLFPLPFSVKAKYFVAAIILIAIAGTVQGGGNIAYLAHLGGLIFAFFYLKVAPRRGILGGAAEQYFGVRNAYYRWKRRRAARKFEVYMRKHDRSQFFDEYGNYRDPNDQKKSDGGEPPRWVN